MAPPQRNFCENHSLEGEKLEKNLLHRSRSVLSGKRGRKQTVSRG